MLDLGMRKELHPEKCLDRSYPNTYRRKAAPMPT
ncbi:hypothetical protein FOMG_19720 [Fusarium oxysporum f. sp. melonis 26406]|uniref:Uncharacterized protein n=1 Tax=Fusarium oxysporum f. sp. melonis 26406 TaxID=1089452 RepID=W9Z5J1_FUSOX|nr:hypothetical protein FOMG_19720 [Fusarium oxysporum f. sp. melonis 26406]